MQGSGPLEPSVQITWKVVFKEAAKGNYKQFLKITDDTGSSTGFGSGWLVEGQALTLPASLVTYKSGRLRRESNCEHRTAFRRVRNRQRSAMFCNHPMRERQSDAVPV